MTSESLLWIVPILMAAITLMMFGVSGLLNDGPEVE